MVSLSPAAARHLQLLLEERKFEERKLDSPIPPVGPAVMPPADPSLVGADGENLNGHRGAGGAVNQGLRVMVEKGGCAGLQYTMTLDYWRAGDTTIQRDGVSVFIDSASLPYLAGAELDYCDDLVGTGFRLHNPNAVRSCGCGTSFEPSAAAEPAVDTGTTAGGDREEGAGKSVASGGEMGIAMEGAG
jgi:iron-sulfur cluster assembly protein